MCNAWRSCSWSRLREPKPSFKWHCWALVIGINMISTPFFHSLPYAIMTRASQAAERDPDAPSAANQQVRGLHNPPRIIVNPYGATRSTVNSLGYILRQALKPGPNWFDGYFPLTVFTANRDYIQVAENRSQRKFDQRNPDKASQQPWMRSTHRQISLARYLR